MSTDNFRTDIAIMKRTTPDYSLFLNLRDNPGLLPVFNLFDNESNYNPKSLNVLGAGTLGKGFLSFSCSMITSMAFSNC